MEGRGRSVADYLDEEALGATTVELPIEDLLPGTEVELAVGDGYHDLSTHHLPLVVSVPIIFSRSVVMVALGTSVERR